MVYLLLQVFALANNAGEYDEMIKEAFIGGHLATDVEHCRMVTRVE
jgi:hypothetical protein